MKERILSIALSALACRLAIVHDTPIDRALPLLGVIACVFAFEAVPLLLVCELAIFDERVRLIAFGCVLALAFGFGLRRPQSPLSNAATAVAAIVLLRWIPFPDHIFRELLLLAVCLAILAALRATPFAIAVAVLTALVTPMLPLRTLALPLVVLGVALVTRPRFRATLPSTIAVAFAIIFFAWSGVVARALPYFLRPARPELPRLTLAQALAPSQSIVLDVPDGVHSLIVSGANVPRLKRGTLLGTLHGPFNDRPIRIGDVADWGFMRREFFYGTRNPLPRDAAGKIRGYGYGAWIDGAGRIPLPRGARRVRVTAAATLPRDASLQVEAFE